MSNKNLFLMILSMIFMITGLPLSSQAKEAAIKAQKQKQKDKTTVVKPQKEEVTIKIVPGSKNTAGIDLTNTVHVRGMQFTVNGVELTEVRTTSRTASFLAKFNEENGIVLLVSLSEDEIAPGKGLIAEIIYKKDKKAPAPDIGLTDVKIVGRDRKQLYP